MRNIRSCLMQRLEDDIVDIIALSAEALQPLVDEGIIVQQGWYDKEVKKLHVTLWSLGDYEGAHADDTAEVDVASVQVNIWSEEDQISLKKRIIKLMKKAGFYYMGGNDELETDTRIFNNAMRFLKAEEVAEETEE